MGLADQILVTLKRFMIVFTTKMSHQRPSCSVIVGDFNAKYSKWHSFNKSIQQLHVTVNKSTHCINDSYSCTDLILLTQI